MTFKKLYDELMENIKVLTDKAEGNGLKPSRISIKMDKLFFPYFGYTFEAWRDHYMRGTSNYNWKWSIAEIRIKGQNATIIINREH